MGASKGRQYNYEAMFLSPPTAGPALEELLSHIKEILDKAGAEVIALRKWDERRLAFEIKKNKRGLYLLAYFSCDPATVSEIERLSNLSEQLLRVMVLRADHLTMEEMQSADAREELATEAALRASEQHEEETAEASA
ncbi:MAG: 30S ribosomal protein S6 [Planctomycetota bacterium]